MPLLASLTAAAATAALHGAPRTQPPASTGQQIHGVGCDAMEGNRLHIHQHLVILDHGKPVAIPADVGRPVQRGCLYWLHTHTPDGIIHIEAPQDRAFTLGDFFAIWGQPLSRSRAAAARAPKGRALKVWVDGRAYTGDPQAIVLARHTDVVIEAGPPYRTPPRFAAWNGL